MPLKIGQPKPTNVVLAYVPHYKQMFTFLHDLLRLQASVAPPSSRAAAFLRDTSMRLISVGNRY